VTDSAWRQPAVRCAVAAQERADTMPGTAAPAAGFLLIEQPGGWGRQALTESQLDPRVGAGVSARAIALGLRALLIRRPDRRSGLSLPSGRRRWAVVSSGSGREQTWWGDFGADDELLTLPLDGSAGEASEEPFFLVCTHARHDTCCAVDGRPVAAALQRAAPGRTWECSHVGGDRFAANVVALPHGIYYGRVQRDDAGELVAAHDRGDLVTRLLRGHSTAPPAAQAAVVEMRRRLGIAALDALPPAGTIQLGRGRWQVRLRHHPRHLIVTLQASAGPEAGLLTCHARRAAHPPRWEVLSVTEVE
jgi:hypothetical protein